MFIGSLTDAPRDESALIVASQRDAHRPSHHNDRRARAVGHTVTGRAARHHLDVLLGLVVTVPDQILGVMLAVFAGFFLYVGAAELLPEAHRSDRPRWVVVATVGGVVAIYVFSVWAGAIE